MSEEILSDVVERAEVERQNRQALSQLAGKYRLWIPQRDYDKWRPTVETTGTIAGLWHLGDLRCIATDGLQAHFVRVDGSIFTGHVQHFKWDVAVESMVPYTKEDGSIGWFKSIKDSGAPAALYRKTPQPRPAREAKPKLSLAEKALKVLKQAQARFAQGAAQRQGKER